MVVASAVLVLCLCHVLYFWPKYAEWCQYLYYYRLFSSIIAKTSFVSHRKYGHNFFTSKGKRFPFLIVYFPLYPNIGILSAGDFYHLIWFPILHPYTSLKFIRSKCVIPFDLHYSANLTNPLDFLFSSSQRIFQMKDINVISFSFAQLSIFLECKM